MREYLQEKVSLSTNIFLSINSKKIIAIISLIIAGEIIFALPFHLARFFRPTLLEVFELTATQLGAAQGLYGIVAMCAYFPGGLLADRFPAHKLMAVSLWMTAIGGVYMASFPDYSESLLLFAFYGVTTIMLFWGALIRATREWGGLHHQGKAFGLLEGGRGVFAVSLASLGVLLFEYSFPAGYNSASLSEKKTVFSIVIYGYTFVTMLTGILAWYGLKASATSLINHRAEKHPYSYLMRVIRIPAVWWQAVIVLCAYAGYKGIDHFSLYAVQAYEYDAIQAAKLVTLASWIRPLAAVLAGVMADRYNPIKWLITCFLVLLLSNLYFAFSDAQPGLTWILTTNVMITCIAVFALRALYFSVFEYYHLASHNTGTAVGIISVIGFLPDVFVLYIAGNLIDNYEGIQGHQYFFMFLTAFSLTGLFASIALKHYQTKYIS